MQREINNEVYLGEMVTQFENIDKLSAINKAASDFDIANKKFEKMKKLIKTGV